MNTFKTIARAALIMAALGTASVALAEPLVAVDRVAVSAPIQSADGLNRRVRVHNQTGMTITHFYASDSRLDVWQEDLLGARTLAADSSLVMNIDDGSGACLYDFKARLTNGQDLTRFNINVCEVADYYVTR